MGKKKSKKKEMAFINVVLYPTERQRSQCYIELLASIMESRCPIKMKSSDKSIVMRTFDICEDYYHGCFCQALFLTPESKTLDVTANLLEPASVDPNKGLDAKDIEFWFFPRYHRFAVLKSEVKRIAHFLFESFKFKLGDTDYFGVFIEKDSGTIERIINAEGVRSIRVKIRYTNNDNADEWEALDEDFRNSDTKEASLSLKAGRGMPIKAKVNRILRAFLHLSKSYGTAIAEIVEENGRTVKIDTKEHLLSRSVDMNQDVAQQLKEMVFDIANNRT